jgi:hypothetical protein
MHAIWIVVLGVIISAILGAFIHGLVGLLVALVVWVALSGRREFDVNARNDKTRACSINPHSSC